MKNSTLLAIVLILIVVRLIFAWLEFKYEHRKNLIRVSRNIFILVYFFIVLIMFLIKNPSIITINSIVNCIVILLGIFIPIYYIFDTARILRRVINKKGRIHSDEINAKAMVATQNGAECVFVVSRYY